MTNKIDVVRRKTVRLGICFIMPIGLVSWTGGAAAEDVLEPSHARHQACDFSEGEQGFAPWITEGKRVPDFVLYNEENPAPNACADSRDWKRALLNQDCCPYCGRSVSVRATTYFFLSLGFLGQGLFGVRFILQWLASEKSRSVVIPDAFWWISIGGAVATGIYAVSIMAMPIILSQGFNCLIYGRNLYFSRVSNLASRGAI